LECHIIHTPPAEVEYRKSFEGLSAIDLDVEEFIGLTDKQKRRAIARRENNDRKKEAQEKVIFNAKEKREADRIAKLAEKKQEKVEKAKAKGKKKVDDKALVLASSTMDQGSHMQGASQVGVKKKALSQLTEDVITQGTQVLDLEENDRGTTEDLILNISIEDLVDDMGAEKLTWYPVVMDFFNKV